MLQGAMHGGQGRLQAERAVGPEPWAFIRLPGWSPLWAKSRLVSSNLCGVVWGGAECSYLTEHKKTLGAWAFITKNLHLLVALQAVI